MWKKKNYILVKRIVLKKITFVLQGDQGIQGLAGPPGQRGEPVSVVVFVWLWLIELFSHPKYTHTLCMGY